MKISTLHLLLSGMLLLIFAGCKENILSSGKPIRIGDQSMIVTETDSNYLKNYTKDISQREQDEGEIARIMVQVDSVKVIEELENFTASDSNITGFIVAFKNCKVIFDGLEAKELTPQNPENSRSVSYLVTKGDLAKIKIKINGLTNVTIKERIDTRLKVANNNEEYLLKTMGKKRSDWFPLAGKENIFVAAGDNSFQFNDLTNVKLKEALKTELQAKNKTESDIRRWMKLVQNTHDYTDAPCKLYVATAQFRIAGKNANGTVNKLIQFDIVE